MTKIAPMLFYLAGAIDGVTERDAKEWREHMETIAPTAVVFFSPAHAFVGSVGHATARAVDHANRHIIAHVSDGVIANLTGPGMKFGTVREIEFAKMHSKPVACVVGDDPLVSLLAHDVHQCQTFDEALEWLMTEANRSRSQVHHPLGMILGMQSQEPEDDE